MSFQPTHYVEMDSGKHRAFVALQPGNGIVSFAFEPGKTTPSFSRTARGSWQGLERFSTKISVCEVEIVEHIRSGVYFLQAADGRIKIGWSKDVDRRVQQLQTAQSSPLTLLGVFRSSFPEDERILQRRFASYHHRGEWYDASDEILSYVKSLMEDTMVKGVTDGTRKGRSNPNA